MACVEPEQSNFRLLLRNTRQFGNIKPFNAGVWRSKALLVIQDSNVETWSFRVTESTSGRGIPALGVSDIMAACGMTNIDVLKLDIEGSEIEVLQSSADWIDKIGCLIIELHDRFRPGCTQALQEALQEHTFERSRSGESVVLRDVRRAALRPHPVLARGN